MRTYADHTTEFEAALREVGGLETFQQYQREADELLSAAQPELELALTCASEFGLERDDVDRLEHLVARARKSRHRPRASSARRLISAPADRAHRATSPPQRQRQETISSPDGPTPSKQGGNQNGSRRTKNRATAPDGWEYLPSLFKRHRKHAAPSTLYAWVKELDDSDVKTDECSSTMMARIEAFEQLLTQKTGQRNQ